MNTPYVRQTLGKCLTGCLIGLVCTASAAPIFRADKNYPNLGLRIRVLGNSAPEPLAMYKTYTYTFTRGEETFKRDMFDPHELWYATQHAGQWRDEANNLLILGRPTQLFPSFPAEQKHVLREDFDKAMADPTMVFDPTNSEALVTWVKAFASCTPKTPEPLRIQSFSLATAIFFPVEESSTLVYAFRVKIRKITGQTAVSDWFCAVIKIADGTLKSRVRKDFEAQFLASVTALPQTGAVATAGVQPKALNIAPASGKTPAAVIPDHPSRTAARKSIANMKDWWYAETPEYIFLSNIRNTTGKSLVKELQAAMPALRGAFAKLIPPFETTADVSVVRICETEEEYKQYVGKSIEWSIGVWNPSQRELVILSQGKDKEKTMDIIKHEGFHQYLFYACNMIENATWFNEGHACFFETATVDSKGRVEIPENARVRHLLENLDTAARNIPKVIRLSHSDFYGKTEEQRSLNYTTSWALIYFLRKGAPSERLTAYASILDTYLKTLATTKDADAATTAAFDGVNMSKLQNDFTNFWKRGRVAAHRYDPLADKKPPTVSPSK